MGFLIHKCASMLTVYNKTTTGYFVNYEKEHIYDIYEIYYPTFSYEINETRYIRTTDTPVFLKMYTSKNEKGIKLLYNENNPNYIITRSRVIWNIAGAIYIFLLIILIIALHIKYNIKNKKDDNK